MGGGAPAGWDLRRPTVDSILGSGKGPVHPPEHALLPPQHLHTLQIGAAREPRFWPFSQARHRNARVRATQGQYSRTGAAAVAAQRRLSGAAPPEYRRGPQSRAAHQRRRQPRVRGGAGRALEYALRARCLHPLPACLPREPLHAGGAQARRQVSGRRVRAGASGGDAAAAVGRGSRARLRGQGDRRAPRRAQHASLLPARLR
mmetsp:Transcript_11391/g.33585  ORF Transcript_11391/g.33585 Transcript_11391/m.33585 type:complete len:203 (+) Transcript_11391:608-1216(+)